MRKYLNNPWVVGAIALIALAIVVNAVLPAKHQYAQAPGEVADTTGPEAGAPDAGDSTSLSISAAIKSLAFASPIRDPFATTAPVETPNGVVEKIAPPDSVDSIHLSAVWIQKDNNLALINGKIVGTGEEIGRLKFESASAEGVWLTHWKGRNFVSVGADFSLSTPASQPATPTSSL